jgi:hypothetical protein
LSTDVAELAHGGAAGSSLPHMAILDPRAGLLRRADAVADGFSDVELARLVRRGELARLQRGTYLTDPTAAPAELAARHALRVAATISDLRVPAVVSHLSAAALHGLPLWGVRLSRVHVLRRPPASGASNVRLHLHVARYADEDIAVVEGLALTDVTRTVVDVARTASFEAAVVVADAALYRRLTSLIRLRECLARMGPVPGVRCSAGSGVRRRVERERRREPQPRGDAPTPAAVTGPASTRASRRSIGDRALRLRVGAVPHGRRVRWPDQVRPAAPPG